MELEQAHKVVEYLTSEFSTDIEVYEDYSGRGMYGAEVTAFVIDYDTDMTFVGYAFGVLGYEADDLPQRIDNIGRRIVIY